jgi:hypothetical protein
MEERRWKTIESLKCAYSPKYGLVRAFGSRFQIYDIDSDYSSKLIGTIEHRIGTPWKNDNQFQFK